MGVLEQVMQLKNQGYAEQDIVDNLQQQGIAPKQITDAINQAKIKNAVSSSNQAEELNPPMPPSQGAEDSTQEVNQGYYTPQTQPMQAMEPAQYQQQPTEYYEESAYAPASTGMDSDTIIEIANQVFSEKIRKTEKRVEELEELKTIVEVKVKSMDERLKRIEKMIDTLQVQILEKIGSYGKELQSTKKEVSMLENTVGKVIKGKVAHSLKKPKKKKKITSSKKKK